MQSVSCVLKNLKNVFFFFCFSLRDLWGKGRGPRVCHPCHEIMRSLAESLRSRAHVRRNPCSGMDCWWKPRQPDRWPQKTKCFVWKRCCQASSPVVWAKIAHPQSSFGRAGSEDAVSAGNVIACDSDALSKERNSIPMWTAEPRWGNS